MYFKFMKSTTTNHENIDYAPKTAVILCLRGGDPSLENCLSSLAAQTFSNFELHFVLDHKQDPALEIVQSFIEESKLEFKTKLHFLSHEIADSCSLKNQAIISAVTESDESIEVFALVDADGVVDPDWLNSLVLPLVNPAVGATTGNRWFAPMIPNIGSLVRQAWNAAALPQMTLYNIPWGGSLAVKRSTITQCNLLDLWSTAFCEDTMLTGVLRRHGLKVVNVQGVIVPSTESTTLGAAQSWISRQLLTVRLHHQSWPLVLAHALFSLACLLGALLGIIILAVGQHYLDMGRLALVVIAYPVCMAALYHVVQLANGVALSATADRGIRPLSFGQMVLATIATQLFYPFAAIKTAFMKSVSWRGIEYSIGPKRRIRMVEYRPYRECVPQEQPEVSID